MYGMVDLNAMNLLDRGRIEHRTPVLIVCFVEMNQVIEVFRFFQVMILRFQIDRFLVTRANKRELFSNAIAYRNTRISTYYESKAQSASPYRCCSWFMKKTDWSIEKHLKRMIFAVCSNDDCRSLQCYPSLWCSRYSKARPSIRGWQHRESYYHLLPLITNSDCHVQYRLLPMHLSNIRYLLSQSQLWLTKAWSRTAIQINRIGSL